jgi:hypothetical protein
MSPQRRLDRHLGLRGWLLLYTGVWAHIGLGVYLHLWNTFNPELPHTHLPVWLRVGGWWASAALAAWASMWKTYVGVGTGLLMLMPLQRRGAHPRRPQGRPARLVQRRLVRLPRGGGTHRRKRARTHQGRRPLMLWTPNLLALQSGPDSGTLGAAFVGFLTLCGVIYTATRSRASSKKANAVNLVGQLFARVESLEEKDGKIIELSSVMSVSLTYIERLIVRGATAASPPSPPRTRCCGTGSHICATTTRRDDSWAFVLSLSRSRSRGRTTPT